MPPRRRNKATVDEDDPDEPPAAPKQTRVRWTASDDKIVVDTLKQAKKDGLQADSGWRPVVWGKCAEALKDNFKDLHGLRDLSGFGWDDGLKMVTATDGVWADLLKRHPEHERWRSTPFPLYDSILELVEGVVATGVGAFHAGPSTAPPASSNVDNELPPPQTPQGKDNDGDIVMTPPNADVDNDLIASSPIRPRTRKRAASSSPTTSTSTTVKKSRNRNAGAVNQVAIAMQSVASALTTDGSPHGRMRQAAVKMMQDDGEFSSDEESTVMLLLSRDKDASISSTFLAAEPKSRRTAFLRKVLAAEYGDE
ncbi:hypothetical protein R3P38DRAFT_3320499 [Favolaschia claudopus]|uniref:Myb/SANT-like domain-containing protein n=1 Tax=Favolaschia claudopus TaxID=2862362 RepID=A0AAW0AXB9_9AGAR